MKISRNSKLNWIFSPDAIKSEMKFPWEIQSWMKHVSKLWHVIPIVLHKEKGIIYFVIYLSPNSKLCTVWRGTYFPNNLTYIFARKVGHVLRVNARIMRFDDYSREFSGVANYLRGTLKPWKFAYPRLGEFDRFPRSRFELERLAQYYALQAAALRRKIPFSVSLILASLNIINYRSMKSLYVLRETLD